MIMGNIPLHFTAYGLFSVFSEQTKTRREQICAQRLAKNKPTNRLIVVALRLVGRVRDQGMACFLVEMVVAVDHFHACLLASNISEQIQNEKEFVRCESIVNGSMASE